MGHIQMFTRLIISSSTSPSYYTAMETTCVPDNYSHTASPNASLYDDCIKVRFNEMEYLPWDNPDNIVSEHVEHTVSKIRNYVSACCAFIGMPANIINMAVFFRQSLKDRVNLCLFSLSLADEIFLVATILAHGETVFESKHYGPVITFLANTNLSAFLGCFFVSFMISAIIACERCFCVLSPLKYQTVLRTRTMAFIIVTVYLVILGLFYIVSFRYYVGCIYEPDLGIVQRTMVMDTFYKQHQQFIDALDSMILGTGLIGTTMIIVLTTTLITAFKLRQVLTWRAGSSSSLSSREVALTKMLIGSSVLFLTCTFPACLFRTMCLFFPEMTAGGRNHNFYLSCLWVTDGLGTVNSSFNIFIYFKMGSRYRDTFQTLFCRKVRKEKSMNYRNKSMHQEE